MIDEKLMRLIREAHRQWTWEDEVHANKQAAAVHLAIVAAIFAGLVIFAAVRNT